MTALEQPIEALRAELAASADPAKAIDMAAYMKHRFEFFGVPAPVRRAIQKTRVAAARSADPDSLLDFAERCWVEPEREFQAVACDVLRAGAGQLRSTDLPRVRRLIEEKAWWDTVDSLAAHTVGAMVAAHPELAKEMDDWIDDPDIWIARTAILHQLMYRERTDAERLFAYTDRRVADREFFIRKALGWALRQYARTDPEAVRAYVTANEDRLSGLTRREALKRLG